MKNKCKIKRKVFYLAISPIQEKQMTMHSQHFKHSPNASQQTQNPAHPQAEIAKTRRASPTRTPIIIPAICILLSPSSSISVFVAVLLKVYPEMEEFVKVEFEDLCDFFL